MEIPNYLESLDDSINIFDMGDLLKEIHVKHGSKIRNEFKGKVHESLYYYWLSNQSPIKIKHLKIFKKYKKNIFESVFKNAVFFSAGAKRVILPKKLTEDVAYLFGAMHGDGHISKNLKNMDLTEENGDYHKIIRKLFMNIFNLDTYIAEMNTRGNIYYRSYISSKVVSSFFRLYCPVEKKKGSLKVPEIFKKNKSFLISYLSGFFDTDGCLTNVEKGRKSLYFVFSQSDKEIVFEIYECLKSLGLEVNLPRPFRFQSVPYSGNRDLIQWKIYIGSKKTLKEFLNLIQFRHPLKKMRAEKIKKTLGLWSSSQDATLTN